MTDRVYPSKPNAAAAATAPPAFPPPKSHLYKPNLHPYCPVDATAPRRRGRRRGCFCLCCFWSILILLILLFLIAVAACVLYVLYTPNRPSFSLNSLRISRFNLTADDTPRLTAAFNLTMSAKNPNKRITFLYDHVSITVKTSNDVVLAANGSFPNFPNHPQNTTVIRSPVSSASEIVDPDSVASLRSDLKKKSGIPLKVVLDAGLTVKMEGIKKKRIFIRVTCRGIHGGFPTGKTASVVVASTAGSKCKVDVRIKIWKWTF